MSLRDKLIQASKLIKYEKADFNISVVSPTRNEERYYVNMTKESFLEAGASEFIEVEDKTGKGSSWARNNGAKQVKEGVIIFTDAHCKWERGSIVRFARMALENTAIIVAPCASLESPTWTAYGGEFQDHKRFPGYNLRTPLRPVSECKALYGSVYAVSVDTWKWLGGWPPTIGWGYNEQALSLLAYSCGVKLLVYKEGRILHLFRKSSPYSSDTRQIFANHIIVHHALSTRDEWENIWYPRFNEHPFTKQHPDIWSFAPTLDKEPGWLLNNVNRYIINSDGTIRVNGDFPQVEHFSRQGNLLIPLSIDCEDKELKYFGTCCGGKKRYKDYCKKKQIYVNGGICLKCRFPDVYKEFEDVG